MKRLPVYLLAAMMLPMLGVWSAAEGQAFQVKCAIGYERSASGAGGKYQECRRYRSKSPVCQQAVYTICPKFCYFGAGLRDRCESKITSPLCDLPSSENPEDWKVVVKNRRDICKKPYQKGQQYEYVAPKPVKCATVAYLLHVDRVGNEDKCVFWKRAVCKSKAEEYVEKDGKDQCKSLSIAKPTFVPR